MRTHPPDVSTESDDLLWGSLIVTAGPLEDEDDVVVPLLFILNPPDMMAGDLRAASEAPA